MIPPELHRQNLRDIFEYTEHVMGFRDEGCLTPNSHRLLTRKELTDALLKQQEYEDKLEKEMTTEISFGNAMVAVEQGKTVQYYNDEWYDFTANTSYNIIHIKAFRWRIKPEPYKREHIIYLDEQPNPSESDYHVPLLEYLIGHNGYYTGGGIPETAKKYKIIVESCNE